MTDQIREIALRFFTLSGITIESLETTCQDEQRGIYLITLKTPDSSLAI